MKEFVKNSKNAIDLHKLIKKYALGHLDVHMLQPSLAVQMYTATQIHPTPTHFDILYHSTSSSDALPIPGPIQVTEAANSRLQYQVSEGFNSTAENFSGGLHITRFGVPMVVVYTLVPASRPVVVVESVVPGAQYNIEVWAVGGENTRRSREPGRETAVVAERSKLVGCNWEFGHQGEGMGDAVTVFTPGQVLSTYSNVALLQPNISGTA